MTIILTEVLTQDDYSAIMDKYAGLWLSENMGYESDIFFTTPEEEREALLDKVSSGVLKSLGHDDNCSDQFKYNILEGWLNDEFWSKESDEVKRAFFNLQFSTCITLESSLRELKEKSKMHDEYQKAHTTRKDVSREDALDWIVKYGESWSDIEEGYHDHTSWVFRDGQFVHSVHDPITIHDWNRAKIKHDTKIRIESPEHSEYVQKLAFESGFEWGGLENAKHCRFESARFLFFRYNLIRKEDYYKEFLEAVDYKEIFIEMPRDALNARCATIDINAKVLAEKVNALNSQVSGNHYKDFEIQPVVYIHKNNIGYIEGNVIKYVTRWKEKNGLEDLEKAKHYIDRLIDMEIEK